MNLIAQLGQCQVNPLSSQNIGTVDFSMSHAPCNRYIYIYIYIYIYVTRKHLLKTILN